jgi:hypothetical protein
MSSRRATFEVQVLVAKNWTVKNLYDEEEAAKAIADQELKSGRVEGVRILRLWKRADGEHAEKLVFEKMGVVKPLRDVRIVPIETAPPCAAEEDFLGPESLATMGRLFRKYLDETCLTPTEVLHVYREYKRIWDTEGIVMGGVDRVALVQTRDTEIPPKTRSEEIYRAIEGIGARARRAERRRSLPRRLHAGFGPVLAEETLRDPFDGRFSATVVLARDLAECRDWPSKLDRLGELVEAETDPAALAILDGVAAQIFASNVVMQDALGPKPHLAAALDALAGVVEGGVPAFDPGLPRREVFAAGLKAKTLPLLHATLLDRFIKMLAGPGELSRHDGSQEDTRFRNIANRLTTANGVARGETVALALLDRAGTYVVEGGVTGRKRALDRLLMSLEGPARRIAMLRALDMQLKREPEVRVAAFDALRALVGALDGIAPLTADGRDPLAPLLAASNLSRWIVAQFPQKAAQPLAEQLDALSARYLVENRVIERMDRAELPLAARATWLLNFLLSGTLTEGKATALARDRICDHLKRPDFVEAFAEGSIDVSDRDRRLREFYALMTKAGFSANA